MECKTMSFEEFENLHKDDEGIVMLGAGGNTNDWIYGMANVFNEEQLSMSADPDEIFTDACLLKTTGGRTDLALVFNPDYKEFNIGKIAIWRLLYGDCSWISDFLVNYRTQYGLELEEDIS